MLILLSTITVLIIFIIIDSYLNLDLKSILVFFVLWTVVLQCQLHFARVQMKDDINKLTQNLTRKNEEELTNEKSVRKRQEEDIKVCKEQIHKLNTKLNRDIEHSESVQRNYLDCMTKVDNLKQKFIDKADDFVDVKVDFKVCDHMINECNKKLNDSENTIYNLNRRLGDCEIEVDPMKTLLIQVKKNSEMMERCAQDKPSKKKLKEGGFFSSNEYYEESTVSPHCETVAKEYSKVFDGIARLVHRKEISQEKNKSIG